MPRQVREPECSSILARPVLAYLRDCGLSVDDFPDDSPLDMDLLQSPDGRLPHGDMLRLFDLSIAISGDPLLGLHAPAHLRPGDFDLVEYAAASCQTAGDAIDTTGRYLHLLAEAVTFDLTVQGDRAIWFLRPTQPGLLPPAAAEYSAAVVAVLARRLLGVEGGDPDIVEIWLPHAPLGDVAEYERVLPAPVRFERPSMAVVLKANLLQRPMSGADPALRALLERHAQELAARQPRLTGLAEQARGRISEALRGGDPSADRIASTLGMSGRTLHRRLRDEGTTFKDLLDETRHQLALGYLRDPRLSIGEVAFLLGFSASSAFHRAFRRWTGQTPLDYRGGAQKG